MEDIANEARMVLIKAQNLEPGTGSVLFIGKDLKGANQGKKGYTRSKDGSKCSKCGSSKHNLDSCWIAYPDKASEWFKKKMEKKARKDGSSTDESAKPYVMMAITGTTRRDRWVVDTGASEHTCNNPELFETLKIDSGLSPVLTAAGRVSPKGIGTVKLTVNLPEGQQELILQDILYMPGFPVNLFLALKLYLRSRMIYPVLNVTVVLGSVQHVTWDA